jgi:indolepyruvate ferredoxin oxidoreductase, beta subunit
MTTPSGTAVAVQPISVLVCALGGEGGGVLSEWLYATAVACGHSAQCTSIPGVAQRTGATTYYVELMPCADVQLAGRRPVFSLNPVPGAIDVLLSSELLETVRQIGLGMSSAGRTTVISSTARALTVMEKMQLGDGRVTDDTLLGSLPPHARDVEVLDMARLAREAGTAISAVMLGALACSGVLPFPRSAYEETIRRAGKGVDASLRGFALAFDTLSERRARRGRVPDAISHLPAPAAAPVLSDDLKLRFPSPVHELLALGHARVAEYQDDSYAQLYATRLERVLHAERAGDPSAANGHATTRETARWLALWMAFDDIVRLAELKLRASRSLRVRREVGARDDEIVKVYDHFKPGVPEVAALLPQALAARLTAWDVKRRARGLDAWALPLKLPSHTVLGALALRMLAGLRRLRRRGSRYAAEQALIERWLGAIERGAREHAPLGEQIARCGRLIKGYGSTNERGKQHLLHVVEHLATGDTPAPARARAIEAARNAALADDSGTALDRTMVAHGAPPRPVREQPIRWYRRRPEGQTAPAAHP